MTGDSFCYVLYILHPINEVLLEQLHVLVKFDLIWSFIKIKAQ